MRTARSSTLSIVAALATALAACGADESPPGGDVGGVETDEQAARKNRVGISVSPQTASLAAGATQQLSASVTGTTNTAVTWRVDEGAAGGTVSSTGLYTAPAASGTYHVTATSVADMSKRAVATMTVAAPTSATTTPTTTTPTTTQTTVAAVTLYGDTLGSGWADWSWASWRNLANTSPVASGTRSIAVTYGAWQGLYFSHGGLSTSGLSYLELSVHGGTTAGAALAAYAVVGGVQRTKVSIAPYCSGGVIPANAWTRCRVPLSALGATNVTLGGIVLQEYAGRSLPTMYVDAVALTGEAGTGTTTSPTTTQPLPTAPAPTEPVVAPTPIAVSVSPQSTSLPLGGSQQFTATVSGTTNANVIWTIQEGSVAGAVSSTGLFTASSAPGTYRVVATSQVDPTKYAVGEVSIAAPPGAGYVTGFQPDRGASAIIDLGNGWYRSNHETFRAYVRRHSLAGDLEFIWRGKTPNDSGLGTQDVTIRIGPNDMNELSIGLWFNDGKLVVQQKYNPEDLGNSWWQAPSSGQWNKGYQYLGGTAVSIQQGQQYTFGYRVVGNKLSVLLNGYSIWTGTIPPESMQYMLGTSTNVRTDNAVVDFRLWLP